MSEEMQEVANTGEGQGQEKELDWKAEVERLKSTNERLLAEAQKFKTRKSEVEDLRNKLNSFEKSKLEEQGNLQELLNREREEKTKLLSSIEAKEKKILGTLRDCHSIYFWFHVDCK